MLASKARYYYIFLVQNCCMIFSTLSLDIMADAQRTYRSLFSRSTILSPTDRSRTSLFHRIHARIWPEKAFLEWLMLEVIYGELHSTDIDP